MAFAPASSSVLESLIEEEEEEGHHLLDDDDDDEKDKPEEEVERWNTAAPVPACSGQEDEESSEEASSDDDDDDDDAAYKDDGEVGPDDLVLGEEDPEAWFMASLVSEGARRKAQKKRLKVVETVLFREGLPVCWLFQDRRGALRRKHTKRLAWPLVRYELLKRARKVLKRRKREENEPAIAILRWRAESATSTVATLLTWRQVKDLDKRKPKEAGPLLTSWTQFVALQPLTRRFQRDAISTGVYVYRFSRNSSIFEGIAGGVASHQTRELLTWPPTKNNNLSRLVNSGTDIDKTIKRLAEKVAKRVSAGAGTRFGGTRKILRPGLRLRSFVAEIIFTAKEQPLLSFVDHVHVVPQDQNNETIRHESALSADESALSARYSEASRILSLARDIDSVSSFSTTEVEQSCREKSSQKSNDSVTTLRDQQLRPPSFVSPLRPTQPPWWQRRRDANETKKEQSSRALRTRLASLAGIVGRDAYREKPRRTSHIMGKPMSSCATY